MSEQQETSRFVTAAFRAWREAGVNFLVLRNYEKLPDFTTNDIDVLVAPRQLCLAEETLAAAAVQAGFRLHNRAEFATLALYFSSAQTNVQVHFDLFTDLKWRGFHFLYCRSFLEKKVDRGLFAVPHPAHEAATSLLANLVYKGRVKEKYQSSISDGFRAHPAAATEVLAATCGPALAEFLVAAGAKENWGEIEARTGALRRAIVFRQLTRHPLQTAASLLSDAGRFVRRALHPPGLTIALCGADGSGKSTAAAGVIERLDGTFSPQKGRQFHWKPPLFSAKRRAAHGPATDPHGKPPRNALSSLAFFGFHWFEFCLGWFVCIWPVAFRGGLVLIDRFYYDFFVDLRRYRLRVPPALVRLGYCCLRKPDLVLLLDAPADVLQRRKQEVPPAETQRQCLAYRELIGRLDNGRIIDATRPPEAVAGQIEQVILDFMRQRAARRCRGR